MHFDLVTWCNKKHFEKSVDIESALDFFRGKTLERSVVQFHIYLKRYVGAQLNDQKYTKINSGNVVGICFLVFSVVLPFFWWMYIAFLSEKCY